MDYRPKETVMGLTEDVQNPKGDRRAKYDWAKGPVWKKGWKFILQEFDIGLFFKTPSMEGKQGRSLRRLGIIHGSEVAEAPRTKEMFSLLMPRLVPAPETVETILDGHFLDSRSHLFQVSFIKFLISKGKLTLEEFKALVDEMYRTEKGT